MLCLSQDYTTDLQLKTVQLTESGVAVVADSLRRDEEGDSNGDEVDDVFDSRNSFAL